MAHEDGYLPRQTLSPEEPATPLDSLPRPFGRYLITELLGEGGMARVFRAQLQGPAGFRKTVALKLIRPRANTPDPVARRDLEREACITGQLQHPNLIDVYELGEVGGQPYLSMECIDGLTLSQLIASDIEIPAPVVLQIALAIASGLRRVHSLSSKGEHAGLVHCDLKPSNVLLSWDGAVKVADFGIAHLHVDADGDRRGTPAYMAPEQWLGHGVDPRTDVFALGLILAEMIVGSRIVRGKGLGERLRQTPNDGSPLVPVAVFRHIEHAVPGLSRVVQRCVQQDPEDRYSDTTGLLDDLRDLQTQVGFRPRLASWLSARQRAAAELTLDKVDPIPAAATTPTHVVAPSNPFVGRQAELHDIATHFQTNRRLVTLKAGGGFGKSRLVLEFALIHTQTYPGGCWFIDLSDVMSLAGILQATANAFSIPLYTNDPLEQRVQLSRALASRGRTLLIFDNFEQVVAHGFDTIGTWLEHAPEALFLVTSREPLLLPDEVVLHVEPLSLDDAAALFEVRAKAAGTPEPRTDPGSVDELLQQIDCNPLAIELAAARSRHLSTRQMVTRLRDRFSLLSPKRGGQASRKTTLRGSIEWSWNLLEPHEQAAVCQLSLFNGGFFMESAEAVLDLQAYPESPWIVDVVGSLFDKSLLQCREAMGRPRFALYKSIHAFAQEQATQAHQASGVQSAARRHLEHFSALGRSEVTPRKGSLARQQTLALAWDNLSAAWDRGRDLNDPDAKALCAIAASELVLHRGPYERGVKLLEQALTDGPTPRHRARVLSHLSNLLRSCGRTQDAFDAAEEAASLFASLGDRQGEGYALLNRAVTLQVRGDHAGAMGGYQEALAIHREVEDRFSEASAMALIGHTHLAAGQTDQVLHNLKEARAIYRSIGNAFGDAKVTHLIGVFHLVCGNIDRAVTRLDACVRQHQSLGNLRGEAASRSMLAVAYQHQQRPEEAREQFARTLAIQREMGHRSDEAGTLLNLGLLERGRGHFDRAMDLFLESLQLHQTLDDTEGLHLCHGHIGDLYLHLGQPRDAKTHLHMACENAPAHCLETLDMFRRRLAVVHALDGDAGEARRLCEPPLETLRPIEHAVEQLHHVRLLTLLGDESQGARCREAALAHATENGILEADRVVQALEIASGPLPGPSGAAESGSPIHPDTSR